MRCKKYPQYSEATISEAHYRRDILYMPLLKTNVLSVSLSFYMRRFVLVELCCFHTLVLIPVLIKWTLNTIISK